MTLQSLLYSRGSLQVLDQLLLPHTHKYEDAGTCELGHHAIKSMKVRGAPIIAITAALALACELHHLSLCDLTMGIKDADSTDKLQNDVKNLRNWIYAKLDFLTTSRPTAVNLFQVSTYLKNKWCELETTWIPRSSRGMTSQSDGMTSQSDGMTSQSGGISSSPNNEMAILETIKELFIQTCEEYYLDDLKINQNIGFYGAQIFDSCGDNTVNILTHCNTGSLATSGYGTALGVIRSLSKNKKLNHVYCTETRPYNQGARLTAYELVYEKIPATLIADSMASFLMQTQKVDAVIVGADRIASNGDTANKIGTYQLAISAHYHNVPFFIAAPTTSFDYSMVSGKDIKIEERPAQELTHIGNLQIAASNIGAWNPSFDITPAHLISGFITEHGVIFKNDSNQYHFVAESFKKLVPDHGRPCPSGKVTPQDDIHAS